jgi:predicted nuclease with RNAse H fold
MTKNYKKISPHQILGIDLGNKASGNTALCFLNQNELQYIQPKKKQDELSIILETIEKHSIHLICIDAPLTLPAVYFQTPEFNDYMYRECDKLCKAMSPMFIGAFTARAIQLKNMLEHKKLQVIEVYPKKLIEILKLTAYYPKKKEKNVSNELIQKLKDEVPYNFAKPESLHQLDALLCWQSGFRYWNNQHKTFGHKKEGIIIV